MSDEIDDKNTNTTVEQTQSVRPFWQQYRSDTHYDYYGMDRWDDTFVMVFIC